MSQHLINNFICSFSPNTNKVIDFIDEEKFKEKNKQSERYKPLKLIWICSVSKIDFDVRVKGRL